MQHEDAWLSSIMPTGWSAAQSSHSLEPLELHKRLVHLATLREAALQHLGQLDGVKVSLTERKATQQGRLLAALDARLATAHAAVEPHRCAAWDLVKSLEKEAAFYSDVLKGIQQSPPAEQWAALTERYQHLQQQVHQQQEQAVKASDLEQTLSASLQPCQPEHVQLVEQLRSQVDSLTQQLQQANMAQQRQQEAEQQQVHCAHELAAMQQLAALVLQQLQVYHCMQLGEQQQQQQLGLHRVAPSLQPGGHHHHQQQQPQQPQHALGCSGEVTAGREATQVQSVSAGTGSCSSLLARCHRLKQQLQQLSDAADMLVQLAPCSSSKPAAAADSAAAFSNPQLDMLSNELQDPLDRGSFGSSALSPGGLAADQVWQEVQGLTAPHSAPQPMQQQQQLRGMSVRLHPALHQHSSGCGGGCSTMPLHVVKLRLAYQQMLHKVQARYQHDLRQLEVKQQEALQAQSHSQQQAMADMVKQHQEVRGRLAAAATAEADLQQQLARLAGDKQMLQQQIDKLQREVGGAAASAIAVVQVQHEQQLLAAKQEQQQLLQDAKRQVESLQQQLQDLRQQAVQQASALPLAETVAALVADATAKQSAQQQEQLQQLESTYQAALQQREQQHLNLLQDLSELRQLQEEASALSSSSAATDVTAAAIPGTAAASAAPAAAPAAAAAYPSASASATLQPLGAWVSDVAAEGAVPPGVRNCSTSVSEDNGQRRTAPSESGQAVVGGCANADPLAQHRGTGHTTTAAAAAASAVEQQRILQMLDSSLSVSQTGQPPKGESQHAERYQQQQQHGGDYHHQQQHAGSFQHQQQQAGEHHEQQQQQQQQQYADGCNSHQQQQQFEPGGQDEDAMGALIAAVLGPGRIGCAQQQLHKQRMAAAQQQHQQHQQQGSSTVHQRQTEAAQQQQQMRVSPRHQPIQPLDLQEELDKLLGLSGSPSTVPSGRYKSGSNSKAAALASKQGLGLGQQALVGYSNSAALAPANAELAAAMARAKVAETCLPALQDISCSSTCNKAAEGPHQPGLKASRAPPNSSGEVARGSDRPPWKPASPGRVTSPQKQRQQQWQQWQQLPKGSGSSGGGSGCGSPNRGGSRTPSPIRQQRAAGQQQQQQQEGLPVLQCVRCGEQEGPGPDGSGACCFHPGLVPAPGPLMYGPEWHACRARCTPDMPGCYTRQDHFFAPLLDCPNRASQPGPPSSTGATTQSEPPARNAPASSSTAAAAAAGGGCSPRTLAARQSARAAEAGGLASPAGIGSPRFTHQQYSTTSSRDRPASSPKRAINSSSSSMSKEKACGVGMSPPWAVATGRYVGAGAAAAGAQQVPSCDDSRAGVFVGFTEPEPRNSLPKPSVWRG